MCGIAGWVNLKENILHGKDVMHKITSSLYHRGPDAYGEYFSAHALLGHCRLIVVDPEGGSQPMTRTRGKYSYTITYNGELYNTLELRRELESRGYLFLSSSSDTEALLLAFMEWGPGCLKRLNGIFAFAIWEEHEQTLFLARDRLGVKPLFFSHFEGNLIFGSEIKALLVHPAVEPVIDEEGLAEILALGPSRSPGHGIFRGIQEVRPAHYLKFNTKGLYLQRYWELASKPHHKSLEGTALHLRELLEDVVSRQLVSDVPLGTLLSGGLDSSALTALASDNTGIEPLYTFSVDYQDNRKHFRPDHFQPDDDSAWVDWVSDILHTKHHKTTITVPDLVGSLFPAVKAKDLPGMADIDSSLLLFCREIKKKCTAVLSGEAADEIFGGYPWFHAPQGGNGFPWIRAFNEKMDYFSPGVFSVFNLEEYVRAKYEETTLETPLLEGETPDEQERRKLFYLNFNWFMTTLLDRKDRMSMACGLEVRVPFCDHRLIEYAWNIPWEIKNCNNREKGILRQSLKGILPHKILERRKSPYPKTHNPHYRSMINNLVMQMILERKSPLLDLLNIPRVQRLAQGQETKFNSPWFGQLMGEVQFLAHNSVRPGKVV